LFFFQIYTAQFANKLHGWLADVTDYWMPGSGGHVEASVGRPSMIRLALCWRSWVVTSERRRCRAPRRPHTLVYSTLRFRSGLHRASNAPGGGVFFSPNDARQRAS